MSTLTDTSLAAAPGASTAAATSAPTSARCRSRIGVAVGPPSCFRRVESPSVGKCRARCPSDGPGGRSRASRTGQRDATRVPAAAPEGSLGLKTRAGYRDARAEVVTPGVVRSNDDAGLRTHARVS
jgi:hypothetical protein